jgi:dipeptidase E
MKLAFYGGGDARMNKELDRAVMSLVKTKNPLMTYVPASSYLSELEFRDIIKQYSFFKVKRYLHLPVDIPVDKIFFREALKSDIIHLGGGNTFHFLKWLKKSGLFKELKKFVERGGVLTGLSAGAIVMTTDIFMASEPKKDCDENEEHLTDWKSLAFVDFDFYPHYVKNIHVDSELRKISKKRKKLLIACADGAGVVVNEDSTIYVGLCFGFYKGKKITLNLA